MLRHLNGMLAVPEEDSYECLRQFFQRYSTRGAKVKGTIKAGVYVPLFTFFNSLFESYA